MNTKKNFAASFMTPMQDKPTPLSPAPTKAQKPKKEASEVQTEQAFELNIQPRETKSRRVQILLKPTDYEKLKATAEKGNCSINAVIESLIAMLP